MHWRIQKLTITTSTNDDVRRAADTGEAEGLVIVAERQSAGRGRQGRVWESPEGNLYCSVLLRPGDMPHDAGLYSFVAALAVRDVVAEFVNFPPHKGEGTLPRLCRGVSSSCNITLKWPNDVLVEGKKISGILLELAGDALIIGIGLNVLHGPKNALYPATSLKAEETDSIDLSDLLEKLLQHLGHWHGLMQTEGFAPIRAAWLAHAQQGKLTVRLPKETLQGEFVGLDETGHLRLRLADGVERSISTGDVVLPSKD